MTVLNKCEIWRNERNVLIDLSFPFQNSVVPLCEAFLNSCFICSSGFSELLNEFPKLVLAFSGSKKWGCCRDHGEWNMISGIQLRVTSVVLFRVSRFREKRHKSHQMSSQQVQTPSSCLMIRFGKQDKSAFLYSTAWQNPHH